MKKARFIVPAICLSLFVLMAAGVAAAPLGDAEKGKTLWDGGLCRRCHGDQGQGLWAGPRAGDTRTAEDWIRQVRTPRANMPSFTEKQVSDQDIRDMLDYMKTLSAVTGFARQTADIKDSDPVGKKLLAQKNCVACHGANGPVNNFTSTGRIPTAEAVIKQLRTPASRMPSFSATQVSDAEAAQIAQFLASQTTTAASSLPRTGDQLSLPLPLYAFWVLGAASLLGGFAIRRKWLAKYANRTRP